MIRVGQMLFAQIIKQHKMINSKSDLLKIVELFSDLRHEIVYDESGRFIIGKKPCARDGHTLNVLKDKMYIFGGDRHLMSFNDLY